ncbi:hypothetical protein DFJ58DRAFT_807417 [Suillus subalutaceus]|uniref:uncharacterized protein n=1 Tax=Suillus subalutaceus TaxID=48586 RepID=UPI001B87C5AC|nr:uncharacterized protein DFJ58DRAFT_807417 [Suillus subalutaceus]KAG1841922.1 hypothetical protein DFJ58DRAFT_807417 [Suillus subalutaceus]
MSHSLSLHDVVGSPPHKRRCFSLHEDHDVDLETKSVTEDEADLGIRQLIAEEIDLEIAIRQRLLSTIDSRITWALMLQEALVRDSSTPVPDATPDDFQEAALDALNAVEVPCAFLFDREESVYDDPEPPSLRSFSPVAPTQRERIPPKVRPTRTAAAKLHPQKKLLYIRLPPSQIAVDEHIAILTCPTCTRTQFTTLQGLLNHARLAHGIEWASHDACITACAVPVPSSDEAEKDRVEEEGVEVPWGGSVVGLQRLFERAVGVNLPASLVSEEGQGAAGAAAIPSTLLSRTLGLHADSPALATFLGRTPKRRCIHAYEEDTDVDILSIDTAPRRPSPSFESREGVARRAYEGVSRHPWRMAFPHRNRARPELDLVVDAPALVDNVAETTATPAIPGSTTSRFHITARVHITDRSLFISPSRRVDLSIPPSHTHRWMLSVTAPSYSIPLASFMIRLTVLAVAPSDNTQRQPCTVDKVPFAIIGSSSEPFLAKVVMEWASGGRMEVEHWIDLDPGNAASSVLGSEQVLDVELDRGTRLLPVPPGPPPHIPSLEREPAEITRQSVTKPQESINELGYEKVLRSLLPRVPMTLKDMKFRSPFQVPYKLVPSPVHLLALVPGRRKAIEWGRARALQALYVQHAASASAELMSLTVGDVYAFLEDSGLFPRSSSKIEDLVPSAKDKKDKVKDKDRETESALLPVDEPCFVCGIKKRFHPALAVTTKVKKEPVFDETVSWVCDIVPPHELERGLRIPIIDLTKIFGGGLETALYAGEAAGDGRGLPHQPMASSQILRPWRYSARQIVSLSPPDLILAIHRSVGSLRLPHFPELPSPSLDKRRTNSEIEEAFAPSALLAAVLKPFIAVLVRSAVDVAKRDIAIASGAGNSSTVAVAGQGKVTRTKRGRKVGSVLTPGHILRGLSLPNPVHGSGLTATTLKDMLGLCLTGVRVPVEFGRSLTRTSLRQIMDRDGSVEMREAGESGVVKVEPP